MRPLRGFGIFVLTMVLASVWGCGSTATKEGTGEYVDDSVITTKVKTAIFNDSSLKVNEIKVETFKGEVQLSGFVRSQADIDQAVQVTTDRAGATGSPERADEGDRDAPRRADNFLQGRREDWSCCAVSAI